MTFNVEIFPEQALLWSVRRALSAYPDPTGEPVDAYLASGSACILSMQAALEAIVNGLLIRQAAFPHWDELRLASKVDLLMHSANHSIDWGHRPWQEVIRLIRMRNWLAHNKDSHIGLINNDGEWVFGGTKRRRIPVLDVPKELRYESVRSLYVAVREAGFSLATLAGFASDYEFLQTEKYEPQLVG